MWPGSWSECLSLFYSYTARDVVLKVLLDCIIYNKWCYDEKYQKEIEDRYGWKRVLKHNNLPESGIGRGSSFGGELEKLSFNERYLKVIENYPNDWVDMCSNKEINNYSKKIFGLEVEE